MLHLRLFAAVSAASLAVSLSGCATSGGSLGGGTSSASHAVTFGGHVHGGNQPVMGATVTLWAAGAPASGGGYGTGATSLKTATSGSDGSFTFDTAGVSPCTLGQYLYITSVGGNTGAGTNTKSAMLAALPNPCSATTGSTYVWINEITTVAAVSALQQFMTITPGGSPAWQIGAPSTNITGLANAFLMTGNLASITTGTTGVSTVSSTVGGTTYTTTVTPDSAKIATLANILAYCVNSTGSICGSLFTDSTPGTATSPSDTIQVAYYLATNAGGLTMPAYSSPYGSPYYLCTTYIGATPPFANGLPCTTTSFPTDWMIGLSYKAVNSTTATAVGTVQANSIAIDGNGNIWTAEFGSSGSIGSVNKFNVTGQLLIPPVTTVTAVTGGEYPAGYTGSTPYTLGGAKTWALAIDTSNNAWYANFYGASSVDSLNTIYSTEVPLAQITPAGVATGYLVGVAPGAFALDSSNNLYMNNEPTSGRYYISELQSAGTPSYSNFYPGAGRGSSYYNQIVIDQTANQNFYAFYYTCSASVQSIVSGNNASEVALGNTALPTTNIDGTVIIALSGTAPTTCVEYGAVDSSNNLWGSGSTYVEYINVVAGTVSGTAPAAITNTPVVTQFAAGSGYTQGGLDATRGVAIDGLGHVWVVNEPSATTGGVSEFAVNTTGTPTLTPLSPAGISSTSPTIPIYGFGSQYGYGTANQPVIDPSGNVWIGTETGSLLNVLVGGAAPVVTPFAAQIAKTAIGVRP